MSRLLTARIAATTALEDRFRLVALCLVGALATAAVLTAMSASAARSSEQGRSSMMTGVLSDTPKETDLLVLSTTKRIEGRRIDVSFIEPMGDDAVRPRGVEELPSVGGALVSPALKQLLNSDERLAARFSVEGTINHEGVVSGSQLLAYVRVSQGALAQDGADILHAVDGEYVGRGPVDRIRAFGPNGDSAGVSIQGAGLSDRWIEPTHVQAVWVLALAPALVLLLAGLGISSEPRTRRIALLQFLGVPRRQRLIISVCESLFPLAIGVIAASVAWTWVGQQTWLFAGTGYEVFPGDAALSPIRLLLVALAVVVVAAGIAAAAAALTKGPQGGRPVQEETRLSRWAALPAGIAAGLLAAATTTPSQISGLAALAGSVLAAVSVPFLVPGILRSVGRLVARAPSPATFMTGRFMGFDPASSARPFAGIATLIVLAGSCAGWIAVAKYVEETPGSSSGNQVTVASWRTASVKHVADRLRQDLPGLVVAEFSVEGEQIVLTTSCESVAAAAVDVTCSDPGTLQGPGVAKLLRGLQTASHDGPPLARITFTDSPHTSNHHHDELIVIGSGDGETQDARVESAIGKHVEVPKIEGVSSSLAAPSPLIPWIGFGLAMAALLLGTGCLLLLSDRFRHLMTQHRALHLIGLTAAEMRQIARLLFTVPYVLVTTVGLLLGTLTCLTISAPVGTPWHVVGLLGALTVLGGAVIGAMLPRRVRLPRLE